MNLENYHIIKVSYLGATNTRGSRVKLHSDRFEKTKIIPYDYVHAYTLPIAIDYLTKQGFELIGQAEGKDCYYIITNTFKSL